MATRNNNNNTQKRGANVNTVAEVQGADSLRLRSTLVKTVKREDVNTSVTRDSAYFDITKYPTAFSMHLSTINILNEEKTYRQEEIFKGEEVNADYLARYLSQTTECELFLKLISMRFPRKLITDGIFKGAATFSINTHDMSRASVIEAIRAALANVAQTADANLRALLSHSGSEAAVVRCFSEIILPILAINGLVIEPRRGGDGDGVTTFIPMKRSIAVFRDIFHNLWVDRIHKAVAEALVSTQLAPTKLAGGELDRSDVKSTRQAVATFADAVLVAFDRFASRMRAAQEVRHQVFDTMLATASYMFPRRFEDLKIDVPSYIREHESLPSLASNVVVASAALELVDELTLAHGTVNGSVMQIVESRGFSPTLKALGYSSAAEIPRTLQSSPVDRQPHHIKELAQYITAGSMDFKQVNISDIVSSIETRVIQDRMRVPVGVCVYDKEELNVVMNSVEQLADITMTDVSTVIGNMTDLAERIRAAMGRLPLVASQESAASLVLEYMKAMITEESGPNCVQPDIFYADLRSQDSQTWTPNYVLGLAVSPHIRVLDTDDALRLPLEKRIMYRVDGASPLVRYVRGTVAVGTQTLITPNVYELLIGTSDRVAKRVRQLPIDTLQPTCYNKRLLDVNSILNLRVFKDTKEPRHFELQTRYTPEKVKGYIKWGDLVSLGRLGYTEQKIEVSKIGHASLDHNVKLILTAIKEAVDAYNDGNSRAYGTLLIKDATMMVAKLLESQGVAFRDDISAVASSFAVTAETSNDIAYAMRAAVRQHDFLVAVDLCALGELFRLLDMSATNRELLTYLKAQEVILERLLENGSDRTAIRY